ncbi:MAG: ATP-binding cassette domain-containing protein [Proteobacteria bacterium]|nr:ATP-binding cassette domain-containing protein [Pseudomonadota bacterium]
MIKTKDLSFRYNDGWILQDLAFSVEKGDFLGIVGPNGTGKTTLLKLLYRLVLPQKGQVLIGGKDLTLMTRKEISRKIAVVSQETQINFPFVALEIVLMGRSPHLKGLQFERKRDFDIATNAMELTDTLEVAHRPFNELSGGEKQRIFIARAVAQETDLILLDEPTANLDIRHQVQFYNLMTTLNTEKSITIVTVSHEINLASEFCKNILLLNEGSVFALGKPGDVITKKNIEAVYQTPVLVDQNPETKAPRVTLLRGKNTP